MAVIPPGELESVEPIVPLAQAVRLDVHERIPSLAKMALENKTRQVNENILQNRSVVVNSKYDKWEGIPSPVINFFLNVVGFLGFIDQPKKGEMVPRHILMQLSTEKLKNIEPHPESFKSLTPDDLRKLEKSKLDYVAPFLSVDQFKALSIDQYKHLLAYDINEVPYERLVLLKKMSANFTPLENKKIETALKFISQEYVNELDPDKLRQLSPTNNDDVNQFFEWVESGLMKLMPTDKASNIRKEFFDLLIVRDPKGEFVKELGENWVYLSQKPLLNLTSSKLTQNPSLLYEFLRVASELNQNEVENHVNQVQIKGVLLDTIKNTPLQGLSEEQLSKLKQQGSKNSYVQETVQNEIDRRAIQKLSSTDLANKLVEILKAGKGRFITEAQMKSVAEDLVLAEVVYMMDPQDVSLLEEHFKHFKINYFKPEAIRHFTDEQIRSIDPKVMKDYYHRINFTLRQQAIILSKIFPEIRNYGEAYLFQFFNTFNKETVNKKLNLDDLENALEGSSGELREILLKEIFNKEKHIIDQRELPILIPYLKYLPRDFPITDLLREVKNIKTDPRVQLLNNNQVAALPPVFFNELSPEKIESIFIFNSDALTGEQIAIVMSRDKIKNDQAPYVRNNLDRLNIKKNDGWTQNLQELRELILENRLKIASDDQIKKIPNQFWRLLSVEELRKVGDRIAVVVNDPNKSIQQKMDFINLFTDDKFRALSLNLMPVDVYRNLSNNQIQQLKPSDFSSNRLEKLRAIKDPTLLPKIITLKLTPEDWATLKSTDGALYSKLRRMHATFIRDHVEHNNGKTGINYEKLQKAWVSVEGRPYSTKIDGMMNIEFEDVKRFIDSSIPNDPFVVKILPARTLQYEGFTDGDIHYNPVKGGSVPHAYTEGNYSVAVNSSHLSTENSRGSDPIADNMRFVSYKEKGGNGEVFIMTGVDPAGNSTFATNAGREAAKGCEHYIAAQLEQNGVGNTREMAEVLLNSLEVASQTIQQSNEQNVCLTTVVGKKDTKTGKTYCMAVGLGDMALRVLKTDGTVQNWTPNARTSSSDVTDPGGRLVNPGLDLRNIGIVYFELDNGDTLLMTSDGPEDKLDPEFNGLSPLEAREEILEAYPEMNNLPAIDDEKIWDDSPEILEIKEAYKSLHLQRLNSQANDNNQNIAQVYVEDSYRRTEERREIEIWLKAIDPNNPKNDEEVQFLKEAKESKLGSKVTLPGGRKVVRGKDDDDSAQAYTINIRADYGYGEL